MTSPSSGRVIFLVALILVTICGAVAASFFIETSDRQMLAITVRTIGGPAEVKVQPANVWEGAFQGASLLEGDSVRTSRQSSIILTYPDGSSLNLGGETEVTLAAASKVREYPMMCRLLPAAICAPRETYSYVASVQSGKVQAHIQTVENGASRLFQLESAYSIAEARGTVLEVEVDADGVARWHDIDGQVFLGYLVRTDDGAPAAMATLLDTGRVLSVSPLPLSEPGQAEEIGSLVEMTRHAVHQAAVKDAPVSLSEEENGLALDAVSNGQDGRSLSASSGQQVSGASACLGCHQELKPKLRGKSRHEPFVKGNCRACHKSFHNGAGDRRTPEEDIALCTSCHDQSIGYSHPVGPHLFDPIAKAPLTCSTSCHDPHGSQYKALSRIGEGDKVCLICHTTLARKGLE